LRKLNGSADMPFWVECPGKIKFTRPGNLG
jgi:hypothetical protein